MPAREPRRAGSAHEGELTPGAPSLIAHARRALLGRRPGAVTGALLLLVIVVPLGGCVWLDRLGSAAGLGGGRDERCTARPAEGVTIRDVDVFQVVGVALVKDGVEVAPGGRNADLVLGREGVMRIRVDIPPGRSAHELAAEVRFSSERSTAVVADRDVEVASEVGEASTGEFQVEVSAERVVDGARYSISVVECRAPTAAAAPASAAPAAPGPRFPAQGEAALGARETGILKLHLVPFDVGGYIPATSPAVIAGFRAAIRSVYPVTDVDITVGEVRDGGDEVDLGTQLVQLGIQRDRDRPPDDVYYYGLVSGAASRDEYCPGCITGTSEALGGFAIGAAFGDPKSEDTLIHELGHLHGLLHAPCGDPDMLDPDYPYDGAVIGVEGYDYRSGELVPLAANDMMGYCFPRWISDYNYQKLVDWVAATNHGAGGE